MESISNVIAPIFWGVLLLSLLVFVHEGGHFLAARACGVRVTEFFLGLPCRFNVYHASRRIGTRFGLTPLLLGGYAAICGMDPEESPHAAAVLDFVHRRGTASVAQIASELSITEEEALDTCAFLLNWGSLAPVYDASKGEGPRSKFYPSSYAAMPRDAAGNTVFDGRAFDRAHATAEGEPWIAPDGAEAFLASERSHTYIGKGFWKRAFMLIAGIAVNLISGVLLFVIAYSVIGFQAPLDSNLLGSVATGSPAAAAGISEGDRILSVDGDAVTTWTEITSSLNAAREAGSDPIELTVWTPDADAPQAPEGSASDDMASYLADHGSIREVALSTADDGMIGELTVWTPDADAPQAPEGSASDDMASYLADHGSIREVALSTADDGMIGIGVSYHTVRVDPVASARLSFDFLVGTAQGVAKLLIPQHTMEVLDNSTSVVGISVMSAEAAQDGAGTFLSLAALISFSLGFMNLLPIPPLDGGKLLIEVIQAVTRREVPVKVQLILSYIGIALFGFLFLYMLRGDILRLF